MTALAAIHVGKKQLGLEEEDYRALLTRVTGKSSTKQMTDAERGRVVEEMRRLGFKQASSAPRKRLDGPFAAKLQALWIAGWNLGVVSSRDDRALIAFVERQTGISHTRFLRHAEDAVKAIEGLKQWLTRAAGVDWSVDNTRAPYLNLPPFQIADTQYRMLSRAGAKLDTFAGEAQRATGKSDIAKFTGADWIAFMNALGAKVRRIKQASQ